MISIILPAKNESAAIGETVAGIRQHYPDAEVIVVNDGSTDNTAEFSEAAGAKVVHHPYSKGTGAAIKTGARVAGPIPIPTEINKYCVNRSPHVDKKSREQFEMRVHKRLIDVFEPTPKTIDSLMNLSLPAGCDLCCLEWKSR